MKIFITGVAKSGTTLLRNLFLSFEGLQVSPFEGSLDTLIGSDYNVVKRNMGSIYSHCMTPMQEIERQRKLIQDNDVKVVHISRNVTSVRDSWDKDWGLNLQGAFEHDMIEGEYIHGYTFKNDIYTTYSSLISEPDRIQKMIADKFGLTIKHKFSEYPAFVPEFFGGDGGYQLRPICAE